ncbi:MAG: thioredoxin domain-containing protein [Acidobacteriota bacterium]|nr:thioredoxin domain-containing protein [Acidobacteriota bacterium]
MTQTHENRLKDSASAYLRSAAHQPIDWNEWGEDAFAKARADEKPILLDIGAVWCHWCHVIDRESYENAEIAEIINRLYVPIKVDRDERPDVDARYQSAISAISGQGGWPLTAFLTPDGKPFFGGTYFPPDDRMGRPGFKRILLAISDAYKNRRAEVDQSWRALEQAVAKAEIFQDARGVFDPRIVDIVVESALSQFDERHGGFGNAPKFPHAGAIDLLLERYQATRDGRLLHVAERTLEGMARGGVYDQLGGGFHRYSVDERWCVPHFEKMSYDNSELLRNYLHAYQVTAKPLYRDIAEGIISWVTEVLSDQQRGGFYASQDADQTLEDDGDYFTWTLNEVRDALSPEESRAIEIYYDVAADGEMHHDPARNVLWVASHIEALAEKLELDAASATILLARARGKLLAARMARRPVPTVDRTHYVGWNAMFISAYLEAARVMDRTDCRAFALKSLDRILGGAWDESKGFLHRIGGPRLEGVLEDQVFAIAALLDAWEQTLDRRYFETAERAMRLCIERFGDPDGGGFFDRAKDSAPLGGLDVRRKPLQDSPTPGANSVAVTVLERIAALTGGTLYSDFAEKTLEAFIGSMPQYGLHAANYALAALLHSRHPMEIVVTGNTKDEAAAALERSALEVYRFGKIVLRITPERAPTAVLPAALRETLPHLDASKAQAIVCSGTTCHPPVTARELLFSLVSGQVSGAAATR